MSELLWVLKDRSGAEMRRTETFESRAEAEAWMSEHWGELAKEGAASVALTDSDETIYDMSLDPA